MYLATWRKREGEGERIKLIDKKRELRSERKKMREKVSATGNKNNMKLIQINGEWRERENKRLNEIDRERERTLCFVSKSCSVQQSHTSSAY